MDKHSYSFKPLIRLITILIIECFIVLNVAPDYDIRSLFGSQKEAALRQAGLLPNQEAPSSYLAPPLKTGEQGKDKAKQMTGEAKTGTPSTAAQITKTDITLNERFFTLLLQSFDFILKEGNFSTSNGMVELAMDNFLAKGGTIQELEAFAAMSNSQIENRLSAIGETYPIATRSILENRNRIRDYLRPLPEDFERLFIRRIAAECSLSQEELLEIGEQSTDGILFKLIDELFEGEHPRELTLRDIGRITWCAFSLLGKVDPQYHNLLKHHLAEWYFAVAYILKKGPSKDNIALITAIRRTGAMLMRCIRYVSRGAPISLDEAGMEVGWAAIASHFLLALQYKGFYRGIDFRAQLVDIGSSRWPAVIFLERFKDNGGIEEQLMRIDELWGQGLDRARSLVARFDLDDAKLGLGGLPYTDKWYVFISHQSLNYIADPEHRMMCYEPPPWAHIAIGMGLGFIFYHTVKDLNDGLVILLAGHEYAHKVVFWLIGNDVIGRDFLPQIFDEPLVDCMMQLFERPARGESGEKGDKLSNLAGDYAGRLLHMGLNSVADKEDDFYHNYYTNGGMTGEKYIFGYIFLHEVLFPQIAQGRRVNKTPFGEAITSEDDALRAFLRHLRNIRNITPVGEAPERYLIPYLNYVFPDFSQSDYDRCVSYYNEHLSQLVHEFFASRFSDDEYNRSMKVCIDLISKDTKNGRVLLRCLRDVVGRSNYTTDYVRALLEEQEASFSEAAAPQAAGAFDELEAELRRIVEISRDILRLSQDPQTTTVKPQLEELITTYIPEKDKAYSDISYDERSFIRDIVARLLADEIASTTKEGRRLIRDALIQISQEVDWHTDNDAQIAFVLIALRYWLSEDDVIRQYFEDIASFNLPPDIMIQYNPRAQTIADSGLKKKFSINPLSWEELMQKTEKVYFSEAFKRRRTPIAPPAAPATRPTDIPPEKANLL
ncbi:MAG: hypothetical protein FJZ16_02580 [Candidatus Omnitrophica bacterium]|nr:hypothetical protein [Candidatus Omnitrophota bacterium]